MYASVGFSFSFVHVYSIDSPFRAMNVGLMLKLVKSLENMFRFIFIWMLSSTFPEFTFVIISFLIKNPDLSSVEVIPFFSPRYKVPSIFLSPFFVLKTDSIM